MAELVQIPTPPVPRWPGLLNTLGGEAAVVDNGGRWESGYRFQPAPCGFNEELPLVVCDGGAFDVAGSNPGAADAVAVDPLYYWSAARCSTFGSTVQEVTNRARTKLLQATSHKLEAELWTGAAQIARGSQGQYLTDGGADALNAGTAVPLAYALGELQNAWGACSEGGRAMIHVTPKTATLWLSAGVIRREAGLLLDGMDNVVVAGTGYDGSGTSHTPDATGNTAWAYATAFVSLRLGPVAVVDDTERRIDTTNNADTAIAYRAGAVGFDSCCAVGVNVDLCTTCCVP